MEKEKMLKERIENTLDVWRNKKCERGKNTKKFSNYYCFHKLIIVEFYLHHLPPNYFFYFKLKITEYVYGG